MISKQFVLAGKAIFTISNPRNERYTFRIKEKDGMYFVQLLTGPNNTKDYTYLGVLNLNGTVRLTAKSVFRDDSMPVQVIRWIINLVWNEKPLPNGYKCLNVGRCGRCGRPLTVPESIESGLGPECANR